MGSVMDIVMSILFVLFMIFIFGGYHKNKSAQREEEFRRQDEIKAKEKKNNSK